MRQGVMVGCLSLLFLLVGCSSTEHFTPPALEKKLPIVGLYEGEIVELTREGATLSSGYALTQEGISRVKLPKGYHFLSQNADYLLAGNNHGVLEVIERKSGHIVRAVALHTPVVSATLHDGMVAYILSNNRFGLYEIATNTKHFESQSERTFAIDTRRANPLFMGSRVVMPMLDGKLILLDRQASDKTEVLYVSSDKIFNNIIFLDQKEGKIVTATPKKLMLIDEDKQRSYHANIAEVAIGYGLIYLFTKEGEIIALDDRLEERYRTSFAHAHFSAGVATPKALVAIEQEGVAMLLTPHLDRVVMYGIDPISTPLFLTKKRLYKEGKIWDITSVSDE